MISADRVEISPAGRIRGEAKVPGDKSISHRLAMIAAVAEGLSTIFNFADSADCGATLECLRRLGVPIRRDGSAVLIEGRGLTGLRQPGEELNAENSGTTVRLLSGIVAAHEFETTFIGDASLSRRPMDRIIRPLRHFGAMIEAREDNYLPMRIHGASLSAIDYQLPIASAQVKSAVLLAGMYARGRTRVWENPPTRNHTEKALGEFGASIEWSEGSAAILGGAQLHCRTFTVPGDFSSAAFLIAAALATPGSNLRLRGVGINPTRSGFLSLLQQMGGRIVIEPEKNPNWEPVADIVIQSSELKGMEIGGSWIPNVIDEIPVLAVLGTRTTDGIRIKHATELRAKESDRIRSIVTNLRELGAQVDEFSDGLFVPGHQTLRGGCVDSFGDHRIAMAFAVAGLFATAPVTIDNASCAGISFPGFFDLLAGLT